MTDYARWLRDLSVFMDDKAMNDENVAQKLLMAAGEIDRLRRENAEVRACFNAASMGMDHKTVFKLITDAKAYVAETYADK